VAALKGENFTQFAAAMRQFLVTHNVVDEALEAVASLQAARPSLVVQAANIYSALLEEKTFGDLDAEAVSSRFDTLVFNATSFTNGNAFRFSIEWKDGVRNEAMRFGDGNAPTSWTVAKGVRLGDAAAASSCFPGGFEPMLWPSEFAGVDPKQPPVPLMDGGIYDNQAIRALFLARSRGNPFDLLLVSDSDQNRLPIYAVPPQFNPWWLRIRVKWLDRMLSGLGLLSAATAAIAGRQLVESPSVPLGFALGSSVLTVLFIALSRLVVWPRLRAAAQGATKELWKRISNLTAAQLVDLVALRGSSVLALVTRVFMKRVRSLVFSEAIARLEIEQLRAGTGGAFDFRDHMVFSLIYDLPDGGTPNCIIPQSLRDSAALALAQPTTLWATTEEVDRLVATGRATTLVKLAEHEAVHSKPDLARLLEPLLAQLGVTRVSKGAGGT
jgi:hypothetical protein